MRQKVVAMVQRMKEGPGLVHRSERPDAKPQYSGRQTLKMFKLIVVLATLGSAAGAKVTPKIVPGRYIVRLCGEGHRSEITRVIEGNGRIRRHLTFLKHLPSITTELSSKAAQLLKLPGNVYLGHRRGVVQYGVLPPRIWLGTRLAVLYLRRPRVPQ